MDKGKNEASDIRRVGVSSSEGARLDILLSELFADLGRVEARAAIEEGRVFIDGQRGRSFGQKVAQGARILLHPPRTQSERTPPAIVYEDEHCLAINKPARWAVNVTETSPELSLVEYFSGFDAHVVHRLDRDTTGIMILAKGKKNAAQLSKAFANRNVHKRYLALVEGNGVEGVFTGSIGRDRRRPRARAVVSHGQSAQTRVSKLSQFEAWSLLEALPITGRTHQIRVHLSHEGAPILGDTLYGASAAVRIQGEVVRVLRPLLHAKELAVPKLSGGRLVIQAPIPDDMKIYIGKAI